MVDKPGSKLIDIFVFLKLDRTVHFWSHKPFTVRKIGDFSHFLPALPSNNQFIINLVKMWPGKAVVGTLKIELKEKSEKFSRVL